MNSTTPATSAPESTHHHRNSVVAFIIGLAIILLASILNAAGLNLTKLDHVRTSVIPKASRRKDWARPLWLLGMVLYILSQLIGSTLALEYMRAEYVAPLGSSSLVFNFLFARFLVGTPVTSTDIYGTIVVVLGVIGIVAFGSINSGLATETDVTHLTSLWRRGGWLGFFFFMALSLILLVVATGQLDAVLAARSELNSVPFAPGLPTSNRPSETDPRAQNIVAKAVGSVQRIWRSTMVLLVDWLELWTAPKGDTTIAWTLGIGWACSGGGLAGGTLVFAKATVNLISGSLSHENSGNQFGHVAPIFTILLLAATAVMQIICLNRGLKVYDSTLVVPVFYGVYTATGFLDSLIFNNQVDSYQSWTLFLIFVSIFVLISGVVLLTHKKPEPGPLSARTAAALGSAGFPRLELRQRGSAARKGKAAKLAKPQGVDDDEETMVDGEEEVLWGVGDASDHSEDDSADDDGEGQDEDVDHHQHPIYKGAAGRPNGGGSRSRLHGEEGVGLLPADDHEDLDFAPPPAAHPFRDNLDNQHR
ncbi:hypothetical protein B0H16DRAFT_1357895 [Mycena metata]|uniref:Uncharacterized protein n=1 Tax=Mycena metata TaxID=1033252 RepID=A0AAD7KD69_9AGAR|nr:hypothetical protein B0H16DRAFT_1357895 [Mycena metata]